MPDETTTKVEEQVEEQVEEPEPEESATDDLGDAGKKALEAERAARKAAEKEAKRVRGLEAELASLREQQMSEQEKAIEQARTSAAEEARNEALTEVNRRLFRAEVKAAAAGKVADPDLLNDPEVAMSLLGLDEVPVTDDGEVDAEAISAALDDLIERKPYLAVGERQPVPDADQGARGNGGKSQLTRDQLRNMTAEQIVAAKAEGRLDKILGRS